MKCSKGLQQCSKVEACTLYQAQEQPDLLPMGSCPAPNVMKGVCKLPETPLSAGKLVRAHCDLSADQPVPTSIYGHGSAQSESGRPMLGPGGRSAHARRDRPKRRARPGPPDQGDSAWAQEGGDTGEPLPRHGRCAAPARDEEPAGGRRRARRRC